MNKKLLAIAVGAAMVAGATAATAGDEPTFYGKLHMSIDSMDNGESNTVPGAKEDGIYVSSNSSRLGLKGKVDLDGGMKAVYKYEMSTDYADQGGDKGAVKGNRNAYLGLNSGGHTVIVGRHDMPFKTVGRKMDLFGDTIADQRALTRHKGAGDDWADRRDSLIMYTGKFGPVGVKVAYAPEEGSDDTTDTGIGITYKGGPVKVMFANETHGKGNLGAPGDTKDSTGNVLGGSYKMGNMKFIAQYAAISNLAGFDGLDVSSYSLGGAMKFGNNTAKLQYTASEFDVTGETDTAATMLAIGIDHAFSKKTKVYAVYAAISNEDNSNFDFSDTGHSATVSPSTTVGDSPSGLSIGMIHKF